MAESAAPAEGWLPPVSEAIAATAPDLLVPFTVHTKPPPKLLCASGIFRVRGAAHAMEPNLDLGGCWRLNDAALQAIAAAVAAAQVVSLHNCLRPKRARRFVRESAPARLGAHDSGPVQFLMRATLRALRKASPADPALRTGSWMSAR